VVLLMRIGGRDKIVGCVHHAGLISGFFALSFPIVRLLWMNEDTTTCDHCLHKCIEFIVTLNCKL
jgi:hypothetical protein